MTSKTIDLNKELVKTIQALEHILEQTKFAREDCDTYSKAMFELGAIDRLVFDLHARLENLEL